MGEWKIQALRQRKKVPAQRHDGLPGSTWGDKQIGFKAQTSVGQLEPGKAGDLLHEGRGER
jgi:hypothetical protein